MYSYTKCLVVAGSSLFLTACGGGGGDSGSGNPSPPAPGPTQIIANAKDYSASQLNNAGRALANTHYTGSTTNAELTPAFIQRVVVDMFGDFNETLVNIPSIADEDFTTQVSSDGSVSTTFMCLDAGSVRYDGKVDSNLLGNLSLTYSNCENQTGWVISGTVAVTLAALSEEEIAYTVNFAGLTWTIDNQTVALYGTQSHRETQTESSYEIETTQYLTFDMGDTAVRMDSQADISINYYSGPVFTLEGDIYFSDAGQVNLHYTSQDQLPPYTNDGLLTLEANSIVTAQLQDGYLLLTQDIDKDGSMDLGAYLTSWVTLMRDDLSTLELFSLDILTRPPQVDSVHWNFYEVVAAEPVVVSQGYIYDPDTPQQDLEVSYNWYRNGQLIADQHTNVLPAGMVVHNDQLEVAMVVFDGVNRIEGNTVSFTVADSPAQVELENIPATVTAGAQIQFTARIVDPDVQGSPTTATMVAGPANATIDEDGIVSWSVPDNFLFPQQRYEFTFGWPDSNNSETLSVEIEATADARNMLVRSGIEVPYTNDSLWVADFDGDGNNELLTTDSGRGVSLINVSATRYQQKWMYSGELGVSGAIRNVLAGDINNDGRTDIVVVTQHGVSLITDINSMATPVFADTTRYINSAQLADINHDGVLELLVISNPDDYGNSNNRLDVRSFDAPENPLFTFDISGAVDFAVANVDNDTAMELIISSGLVYDLTTGENEWFNGSGFGNNHVAAGDVNGDGVAEIIGGDTWGNITLYNARDKSQLASFDNFNTCDLITHDVDEDGVDELIVGDCQWGNISAYSLSGTTLNTEWQADMLDHGSASLTVGDADNDGAPEIFWATGISHTGEDILASADINNGVATTNLARVEVELDYFSAAGWADLLPGQDRAVFFVPQTSSGYSGGRIVTMDSQGNYELGEEISSNWDRSSIAVTTDYNNDGAGDIFVPSTETYDGAVSVIQLHDGSVQWSMNEDYDSTIGTIRAVDMNNDGFDDLVYSNGSQLKAVDVQNQILLGSYTFNNYISDFVAYHNGEQSIALVSFGDRLSLLTRTSSSFAEQSFVNQRCERMELFNYDNDSQPELLCVEQLGELSWQDQTDIIVYELNNNTLTEVQRTAANSVLDVAIDPTTSNEQGWFLALYEDGEYYDSNTVNRVAKYNREGFKIWSGTQLIGRPTRHSMRTRSGSNGTEMLLSTDSAMYWLR